MNRRTASPDWLEWVLAIPLFMFGLAATGVMPLVGPLLCTLTVPYVVNSWLHYVGRPEAVTWWMGGLVGFLPGIAYMSVLAVIATWILMLFMG